MGITTINYFIPAKVKNAIIQVTNLQGEILLIDTLKSRGNDQYVINKGKLMAGQYFYSLMVDGEVIDTKSMIIK